MVDLDLADYYGQNRHADPMKSLARRISLGQVSPAYNAVNRHVRFDERGLETRSREPD